MLGQRQISISGCSNAIGISLICNYWHVYVKMNYVQIQIFPSRAFAKSAGGG